MADEYRYGDLSRVDKMMEELTLQGFRPGKVARLHRKMEEASKKVEEAILDLNTIRDKIKPLCTHSVEDLIFSEFGVDDTLGNYNYTISYLTCKLCGKELYRNRP